MLDRHYYSCTIPSPGNGEALRGLLERFNPTTTLDADLLKAAFATPLWGGESGSRPVIVITSDDGRGVGKTTIAEMVGERYFGVVSLEQQETMREFKTRLLSPDALSKCVVMIDNVKSYRLSWAELEALVTAPTISGRRLYVGEAQRPNTLSYFVTLNGASFSTDLAQRSAIIKVSRPIYAGGWEEETRRYIQEQRQKIFADIIGLLRAERYPLARYSRWGPSERDIQSRLPEPSEAQSVILQRQKIADVELEETDIVEEPSYQAANRRRNHATAGREQVQCLGPWFVWIGEDCNPAEPVRLHLTQRLEVKQRGF